MVLSDRFSTPFGVNRGFFQIVSSHFKKEKIWKILLTLGFFLTTYNVLILFFHQPQGYVVDIYSELPLIFFLSLIICYILGSAILFFYQGITRKLGIMLLVFTYTTVLIIPYMLGYYSMGRGDDLQYIGEYLQISNSGNIAGWDIYPASHIIGAAVSIVTGLAPHITSFVIPFIFSFLFVGGLILCCRIFLKDQVLINIAIPSSFIFYLGPYHFLNVPHALFFAIMPLFIFIVYRFIKEQNVSDSVLVLPIAFLVPFMHPFIVLFVILTLFTLIVFSPILKRFVKMNYWRITNPFIIVIIGFFSWFIFCSTLLGDFGRGFQSYQQKITQPVFFETTEKLASIHIDSYKIVKLVMVYYGRYTIPIFIIAIALIIIYFKRDRISSRLKNCVVVGVFFYILFLIIELILFFNPIISHQPDRLTNLNYIVYAQVPLFVLSLYIIFMTPKLSNRRMIFLLLILSIIWGLSLFGTFNSPNIFKPFDGLSNNEVQGMKWFYNTRITQNVITPISQINLFHDFFADGYEERIVHVPDHFGYVNDSRSFGKINLKTNDHSYIVLLTIDEFLYQKVPGYMEVGRYNAEDFLRFRNDYSIDKIFDDLNIEIYQGSYV